MGENKMSFFSGGLLWFGAAISIAEISTGAVLAPMGFRMGLTAILAGHVIGCFLLYFAGLIGAQSKMTAMETVRFSFGKQGSVFFSVLNILQLVGWTAVMIINGAQALEVATDGLYGHWVWCVLIAALIALWIVAGIKNVGKLNFFAVGSLFALTVVLGSVVFKNTGLSVLPKNEAMTFGMALELSIAMPLSWLPLISDYTRNTDKPALFTFVSTLCYFIGSSFMYAIGLGAAVFAGNPDTVKIMMTAGLGVSAILIVVLSTVTTTFLDVYSAGESMLNINPNLNRKLVSIIVCILGTFIAMFVSTDQYENFLYLISSVFVPMSTILITDYFITRKNTANRNFNLPNILLWGLGFVIYRLFLNIDTVLGSTIPVMIIVSLLCVLLNRSRFRCP